jgi:hypothetical protein
MHEDAQEIADWLVRLERDGFIEQTPQGLRTTRRWHTVVARSVLRLFNDGQDLTDLRVPTALALVESYDDQPATSLAAAVRAILPIVVGELSAGAPK